MLIREVIVYYKLNFVEDSFWSSDQNSDRNTDSKDQAWKISADNKDSTGSWTRGHMCYTLVENLSSFFPCPETLYKD